MKAIDTNILSSLAIAMIYWAKFHTVPNNTDHFIRDKAQIFHDSICIKVAHLIQNVFLLRPVGFNHYIFYTAAEAMIQKVFSSRINE